MVMHKKGNGVGNPNAENEMIDNSVDADADIQDKLDLSVRPIEQSDTWDCGPTALAMALQYQFSLKLTASETILLCGATPSGTDEYNFAKALDILGFKYKQSNSGSLNKLKKSILKNQTPLVHLVIQTGEGHYVVVTGYDEENVRVADPASGKIVTYGIPYFMGIWKIEEKEQQTRWYMCITNRVENKIPAVITKYKKIMKKLKNLK